MIKSSVACSRNPTIFQMEYPEAMILPGKLIANETAGITGTIIDNQRFEICKTLSAKGLKALRQIGLSVVYGNDNRNHAPFSS